MLFPGLARLRWRFLQLLVREDTGIPGYQRSAILLFNCAAFSSIFCRPSAAAQALQ